MSESVIRHRGGKRDEDGKLIGASSTTISVFAVAPGGGTDYAERAREGETVDFVVYSTRPVDITSDDELTVRGKKCTVVVNEWRFGGFDGREILCTRSAG
ncbi:hypothetical protein [Gordonia iterans]